jgi:3-methyl-2-oxobutanoate hydroxymethyltransferase
MPVYALSVTPLIRYNELVVGYACEAGFMNSANAPPPVTVPQFRAAKDKQQKLVVVTAYDYTSAYWCDAAGVDAILVGDSLGMVVQGQATSLSVTLKAMIYHSRCAARGTRRALLIADLPFLSYQISPAQAVRSAGRLLKYGGAQAVKLEGGVRMAPMIRACVQAGIPVMGHIGLTPQAVHQFGGFRVQRDRDQLLADAHAVVEAGAFAMVLESIPLGLAAEITAAVPIPTIGIGAGPHCDGQVLVFHDLLGLYPDLQPRFVKRYADIGGTIRSAIESFCHEVRSGAFPTPQHSFR